MRYFFIDLENVRSAGLEGVLSLADDDTVYIFYSDNAYNLTIPTLESINNSKATVRFIKINYLGANAMDFQIVSLFGAMIERQKKGFFYIISHDNGFKSAINFCTSYFESYDIHLGEYDNIISALTAELKSRAPKSAAGETGTSDTEQKKSRRKRGKRGPADTIATETEPVSIPDDASVQAAEEQSATAEVTDDQSASAQAGAAQEKSGNSRSRRRRNRHKKASDQVNTEQETEPVSTDSTDTTEAHTAEDECPTDNAEEDNEAAQNSSGESANRRRRSRNRHRGHRRPEELSDTTAEQHDDEADGQSDHSEEKPTGRSDPNDRSYIYASLKGLLSDKTIGIYADAIHEALGASRNRDELHRYFHRRYGADEGEALYRVIQSDFDKLKSQRS